MSGPISNHEHTFPADFNECTDLGLKAMLYAACAFTAAAELAPEGEEIGWLICLATRLRDLHNEAAPDTSSWPRGEGVAALFRFPTGERMNG